MPFIGTQPDIGGYSVLDNLTASATASYTLQLNSVNFSPSSANQLLVSLNGVIQKPGSSFTVSGSTLTFSSALTSSDSIDFIVSMGEPLLVGTPSDGTITAPKLSPTSITGQTAETTVANNDTVLIHDTSASALRKMTVSNLVANASTAGLSSDGNNITVTDGDIVLGGTGHGIYLGVTSATAANLLDDYEEGTFNFEMVGYHGSPSPKLQIPAHYTKIGNTVSFWAYATGLNTAGYSGDMWYTGLPFTAPAPYAVGNVYIDKGGTYSLSPFAWIAGGIVYVYKHNSNASANAVYHNATTGVSVQLFGTYKV